MFCDIVAGRGPAIVVHSDEAVIAFLDIRPLTTGHLLVIPRVHAAFLADLDPAVGGLMFGVAQRMAAALRRSGLPCDGVNLFLADGEAAFQEVFHTHLHVVPRTPATGSGSGRSGAARPGPNWTRSRARCATASPAPNAPRHATAAEQR